jgi:hypothetical protein
VKDEQGARLRQPRCRPESPIPDSYSDAAAGQREPHNTMKTSDYISSVRRAFPVRSHLKAHFQTGTHSVRTAIATSVLFAGMLATILPSRAQSTADLRAGVPSPLMLARGDAGVAFSERTTAIFYNPAHLGQARGAHFTILGVSVSYNPRVADAIDFYADELLEVEYLPDEELEDLKDRTFDILSAPITLRATAHLPSFTFRAGTVGFAFGTFVQQTARAHAFDTGAEYPSVSVFGQVDGIISLSAGAPVKGTDFTVGLSARYVRRHVTSYAEVVDQFDTPPILFGSTVAFDIGGLYRTPVPGLTAGLTIYDLIGGRITYREDDFYGVFGDIKASPTVDERARRALTDNAAPSIRFGAAYEIPPQYLGGFGPAVVMADWVSASTIDAGQPLLRKLRLGAETGLGPLRLRAGLGQGYPSFGAGLNLLVIHVDYALFAQQEGAASARDNSTRAHLLQVRFGR